MSSFTDRLYSTWMGQNGSTGSRVRRAGGMGALAPMTNQRGSLTNSHKPRGNELADNAASSRTEKQTHDYVDNIKKVV